MLLLQGASKPPRTPQPAGGSQGLDPVTGQRSASSTLATRKIKKQKTAALGFFFLPSSVLKPGQRASGEKNLVAGVCILKIYLAPIKAAEQNPSQTLVEQLYHAVGTGCSSSLKINPGIALYL